MELSHSNIRYLLGIYELGQGIGVVRSSDLARHIGVTKASVVKMCASHIEHRSYNKRALWYNKAHTRRYS